MTVAVLDTDEFDEKLDPLTVAVQTPKLDVAENAEHELEVTTAPATVSDGAPTAGFTTTRPTESKTKYITDSTLSSPAANNAS